MAGKDWLDDCAQRYPERVAVIDAVSGRRHSFRGFDSRANQIAHFCEQWVGLVPGDCIALVSTPSDDVLQIVAAAGRLGVTALLLDPVAPPETLIAHIDKHCPRTIFHGLAQADLVQEIWFEVDSVEHLIPLRGAVDTASFEEIVAHYQPTPPLVTREGEVAWVHFAAVGISWPGHEAVCDGSAPHTGLGRVSTPLHHPDGLGAAIKALCACQCVVVEVDGVRAIEAPAEMRPTEEDDPATQRNVPKGRSWLPHEFL